MTKAYIIEYTDSDGNPSLNNEGFGTLQQAIDDCKSRAAESIDDYEDNGEDMSGYTTEERFDGINEYSVDILNNGIFSDGWVVSVISIS